MKNKFFQSGLGFFLYLTLAALPAFSQTDDSPLQKMTNYLSKTGYFNKLENLISPACAPTVVTPALPQIAGSSECVNKYKELYSKPDVNVTMAFGYSDNRPNPTVFSGVWALNFMTKISRPCSTDGTDLSMLCGFTKDQNDSALFSKSVLGPDGKMHQFKIHVVSAIDPNQTGQTEDDLRKSPAQKARSAQANAQFQQALQKDDVVIYDGPSRNCAGPDFNAPVLTSDEEVDSDYYQKNHTGLNDMLKSLSTSGHRPKAIALFSSNSKSCFQKQLSAASANSALVTNSAPLPTNVVDVLYGKSMEIAERNFLDGLLNLRCDAGFVQSMQDGDSQAIDFNGWGVKTPNVASAP